MLDTPPPEKSPKMLPNNPGVLSVTENGWEGAPVLETRTPVVYARVSKIPTESTRNVTLPWVVSRTGTFGTFARRTSCMPVSIGNARRAQCRTVAKRYAAVERYFARAKSYIRKFRPRRICFIVRHRWPPNSERFPRVLPPRRLRVCIAGNAFSRTPLVRRILFIISYYYYAERFVVICVFILFFFHRTDKSFSRYHRFFLLLSRGISVYNVLAFYFPPRNYLRLWEPRANV